MPRKTGFYLMSRGWMDSPALQGNGQPYCRRAAWAWLIEEASYEDEPVDIGNQTVVLRRGQLAHSIRFLAEAWKWKRSAVERFLDRLKSETMIETSTETRWMVITICNYSKYQAKPGYTETTNETHAEAIARRSSDDPETNLNKGNQGNQLNQGKREGAAPPLAHPEGAFAEDDLAQPDLLGDVKPLRRKAKVDHVPAAIEIWNEMQKGAPKLSPALTKVCPKMRRAAIQAVLDKVGLDGWREGVRKVSASRNLCGEDGTDFKGVSIDYLAADRHFYRILEGQYAEDRGKPNTAPYARPRFQSPGQERSANARDILDKIRVRDAPEVRPDDFEGQTLDHTEFSILEDLKV